VGVVLADATPSGEHLLHLDSDLGGPGGVLECVADVAVHRQHGGHDVVAGQLGLAARGRSDGGAEVGVSVPLEVVDVLLHELGGAQQLQPRGCTRQWPGLRLHRRLRDDLHPHVRTCHPE
jgi:hypothetical protein